jgi:hypothetical protein
VRPLSSSSPLGVAMWARSLLPLVALFIATAHAAGTYGKNVVPYIPQVPHPISLISLCASNNFYSPFSLTGTTPPTHCRILPPPNAAP